MLPYLWLLPSSLAGDVVSNFIARSWGSVLLKLAGLSLYVLFFSVFLWRRNAKLFAGEDLGESAAPAVVARRAVARDKLGKGLFAFLAAQVLAVFSKELAYLRRSSFLFFSLFIPPVMVFYFSFLFSSIHSSSFKNGLSPDFFFPGMIAYLVLMFMAPSYNSFAYDRRGIQTYFSSPVKFSDILLAKNLVTLLILFSEIAVCAALIGWRSKFPAPPVFIATIVAVVFSVIGHFTIANWPSFSFPRNMESAKIARR